jgi:threonine dehydratase
MNTTLFEEVKRAQEALKNVVTYTPLQLNVNLSESFDTKLYLKREDLQPVRSYKIRGAFNKISGLSSEEKRLGVVCASAGNHAQGVAWSCNYLGVKGRIYMPVTTPAQKIKQVTYFGKGQIELILAGDTFDDAFEEAARYAKECGSVFVHPFDDEKVIAGQGTIALEILKQASGPIDYLFLPVGGGGLAAGVSTVFRKLSPHTKIIGVEPLGAASMYTSMQNGVNTTIEKIDKFVDGAAVKRVGDKTFAICRENLDEVLLVPEGKVCSTILRLYNEEGMVLEPAGALSVAVLEQYAEKLKGKTAVCVISGSNNDITRTEEIRERSLLHEGLKHYFIIRFPQRPGALREFLNEVLGKEDDITCFQFAKKNNRENAPAFVGVELSDPKNHALLLQRMKEKGIVCECVNQKPELFEYLI